MKTSFVHLSTPTEVKSQLSLTPELKEFIEDSRETICKILCGNDHRKAIITGPCSIHNWDGAVEYATKLAALQEKVKDEFLLVMRVYFEKPRSRIGWKGILYDPYLSGKENIGTGICYTRSLMKVVAGLGVPIASEIVDPLCFQFFSDLLCWICIGARTTSSQVHRQNVSGIHFMVGYKNDTHGSIANAVDSIVASDTPHQYFGINEDGQLGIYQSHGNPFSHIILRGGKKKPNYHPEDIELAVQQLSLIGLNPYVMIDCSHDNCDKNIKRMPDVFKNVVEQIAGGNDHIKGIMLESNILEGNQCLINDLKNINPLISITDPCISWEETERIILEGYDTLKCSILKQ